MTAKTADRKPPADDAMVFERGATADASDLAAALLSCNDPELLDRLLVLREQTAALYQRKQFHTALAEFQSVCPAIPKSESAAGGRYHFAPLDRIIEIIRAPLAANGLAFSFRSIHDFEHKAVTVTCRISHVGGWFECSDFTIPLDNSNNMNPAQHAGTASSYAKRYALCSALGLAVGGDDDDAQGTSGGTGAGRPAERQRPTARDAAAVGRAAEASATPPAKKADITGFILEAANHLGYDTEKVNRWVNKKYSTTTGLAGLTEAQKAEVLRTFREQHAAKQVQAAATVPKMITRADVDSTSPAPADDDDAPELEPASEPGEALSKGAVATLRSIMKKAGLTDEDFHDRFGFGIDALRATDVKTVHAWVKEQK